MQGSLAGGVGAADDVDLFALAGAGLDQGRTIVDAAAGEAIGAGDIELAVLDPGRQQYAVAGDFAAIGKLDEAVLAVDAHAGGALSDELRTEARGLGMGAASEVGACNAGGKAEIVFDARTGTGLPAGRQRFDDKGAQAFAGAVDPGSEARRTGADHDQVVEFLSGLDAEADAAGKQFEVRVNEHRAVGKDQHGKLRGIELAILE